MSIYSIRFAPTRRAALMGFGRELMLDGAAQVFGVSAVRSLVTEGASQRLELELDRDDHLAAVNEIVIALQQIGYAVLDAEISEWVDATAALIVTGALGGGILGLAANRHDVALWAGVIGSIAGALAGRALRRVEPVYIVRLNAVGQLVLTDAPRPIARPVVN